MIYAREKINIKINDDFEIKKVFEYEKLKGYSQILINEGSKKLVKEFLSKESLHLYVLVDCSLPTKWIPVTLAVVRKEPGMMIRSASFYNVLPHLPSEKRLRWMYTRGLTYSFFY